MKYLYKFIISLLKYNNLIIITRVVFSINIAYLTTK
jgi:hypothetical protein